MAGHGSFSNSITVYFQADVRELLRGRNLSVIYVLNSTLRGFLRFEKPFDHGFLAVNAVGDAANPITAVSYGLTEERTLELVYAALGTRDIPVTIENVMHWQAAADVAGRFREGRVFLAGDAAHQTPPFLGQGLNAGFRDAVNLAWKIPLVLEGACDARLLESYAAERDAHARDLVEWAVAVGKLMETLAAREAGRPDPHPRVDQRSGYGQGRSVPPLRGGVLQLGQLADDSSVGCLLRQPTLREPGGAARRLDEWLGRGFSVIGRKASDLRVGGEAEALLRRLGARTLALEGLEVAEGELDHLFERHPAAVGRPDRYVYGLVDEDHDLDWILETLGRGLALR
jgi:hypothetical protein